MALLFLVRRGVALNKSARCPPNPFPYTASDWAMRLPVRLPHYAHPSSSPRPHARGWGVASEERKFHSLPSNDLVFPSRTFRDLVI